MPVETNELLDEEQHKRLIDNFEDLELKEVTPVNYLEKGDEVYDYKYTFTEVHHDELETPVEMGGRLYVDSPGEGVWSIYSGRAPILVKEDGAYTPKGEQLKMAQNQAYYALSIMASDGLVSNWGKA